MLVYCENARASVSASVMEGLSADCAFTWREVDVVIHASAGVATSAQAMARCMGGSPFVCVCSHALGIFSDPPSTCGDSDLRCFIDCV